MLPAALEYPSGIEMVSVCTVPAREGRSCEHFGGYTTINRISLPLYSSIGIFILTTGTIPSVPRDLQRNQSISPRVIKQFIDPHEPP